MTSSSAPRLRGGLDPVAPLKLYHTLEYLPSFEDFTGDYLLNLLALTSPWRARGPTRRA